MALSEDEVTRFELFRDKEWVPKLWREIGGRPRRLPNPAYEFSFAIPDAEQTYDGVQTDKPESHCHVCDHLFTHCTCKPNLTWEYQFKEKKSDA